MKFPAIPLLNKIHCENPTIMTDKTKRSLSFTYMKKNKRTRSKGDVSTIHCALLGYRLNLNREFFVIGNAGITKHSVVELPKLLTLVKKLIIGMYSEKK